MCAMGEEVRQMSLCVSLFCFSLTDVLSTVSELYKTHGYKSKHVLMVVIDTMETEMEGFSVSYLISFCTKAA